MSYLQKSNRHRWSTRSGRRSEEARRGRRVRLSVRAKRKRPTLLIRWGRALLGRIRQQALTLLLVLFLGGTVYYLLSDERFKVHKVIITGAHSTAIVQIAQSNGLAKGNIFLVDTERLRQQVITLPNISDVRVFQRLPDELLFHVIERTATVAWQVKGQLYGVDSTGRIISTLRGSGKLLVIHDSEGHDLYERPIAPAGYVDIQAAELARELNRRLPAELGYTRFTFDYARSKGLSVIFPPQQLRVLFGDESDLDTKLGTLQTVIALGRQENIQIGYIDVRFKDRPYYRLSKTKI